jgi:putative transcriptional regulator
MNKIKLIRERLGLTQAALVIGLGCTQGNIGHCENKNQTIPPDVAKLLIVFDAKRGVYIGFEDIYGLAAEWTQGWP